MMSDLWWGVLIVVVGCYGWKLAGLSVPEWVLDHRITIRAAALIPIGLLAALVAVQTFADGTRLTVDARLGGLAMAALLLSLRVPFLPMIVGAAATAAAIRWWW